MRWSYIIVVAWALVFSGIAGLAACVFPKYAGDAWVYLLFTVLSTAVLYVGFGRGAIFFDAFLGVLLWIGFWLKFSVRTAFFDGRFTIAVGEFDGSAASLDHSLMVVSCALAAILLARLIRPRFIFSYPKGLPPIAYIGIFAFYKRHRVAFLMGFLLFVVFVCATNAWLGIYQRGQVARTVFPFGLNGIYTWLLLFGMASVSALILRFEFDLNRERYWIALTLAILEAALSNISMWSRGMILNGSSLLFGVAAQFKRSESHVRIVLVFFACTLFVGLFVSTVLAVNGMRAETFYESHPAVQAEEAVEEQTKALFLDRWVGIEGVMAVAGSSQTGWAVFGEALRERFDTSVNSFYDSNFLASSVYDNSREEATHFISLPGYIAFLFYPGSFVFLFGAVFAFSMAAALLEFMVYRLGGRNLVFCALIAQVIAFRYTSFGYVPAQSYLLFGSIILNVLVLYFSDRLLRSLIRTAS